MTDSTTYADRCYDPLTENASMKSDADLARFLAEHLEQEHFTLNDKTGFLISLTQTIRTDGAAVEALVELVTRRLMKRQTRTLQKGRQYVQRSGAVLEVLAVNSSYATVRIEGGGVSEISPLSEIPLATPETLEAARLMREATREAQRAERAELKQKTKSRSKRR